MADEVFGFKLGVCVAGIVGWGFLDRGVRLALRTARSRRGDRTARGRIVGWERRAIEDDEAGRTADHARIRFEADGRTLTFVSEVGRARRDRPVDGRVAVSYPPGRPEEAREGPAGNWSEAGLYLIIGLAGLAMAAVCVYGILHPEAFPPGEPD